MWLVIRKMLLSHISTFTNLFALQNLLVIWSLLLIISCQTKVMLRNYINYWIWWFNHFISIVGFSSLLVFSAPFIPHMLEAWSQRHHPNLHFIFYEDLKKVTNLNLI